MCMPINLTVHCVFYKFTCVTQAPWTKMCVTQKVATPKCLRRKSTNWIGLWHIWAQHIFWLRRNHVTTFTMCSNNHLIICTVCPCSYCLVTLTQPVLIRIGAAHLSSIRIESTSLPFRLSSFRRQYYWFRSLPSPPQMAIFSSFENPEGSPCSINVTNSQNINVNMLIWSPLVLQDIQRADKCKNVGRMA